MSQPVYISGASDRVLSEWEEICQNRGLPHDAAIHFVKSSKKYTKLVYDAKHSVASVPVWYRINHSAHPNVRVRCSNSLMEFVSTCEISQGDEMVLEYPEPDPSREGCMNLRCFCL